MEKIDYLGYSVTENTEDFFQKVISCENNIKPTETTVNTARKFVNMIQEKPKSLVVFEDLIIIDYDHSIIEVKNNIAEFLFLGKIKSN